MLKTLPCAAAVYGLAAGADALMTLRGIGADLSLEGNPVLRSAMRALGPVGGLAAFKAVAGVALLALAVALEPEIRRKASWIERIPSTPWARAWYRRGERSWLAWLPLYGTAAAQLAGALSWAALLAARP